LTFSDFRLAPELQAAVKRLGFEQPTPIQRQAIPPAQAGRDILASAGAGSGKTTAFLLPIMDSLLTMPRGCTRALVLAPTRELAARTVELCRALAGHTSLRCAAIHGETGMGPQEQAFRQGVDLVVATPGRLLDHFRGQYAGLEALRYLVLDDADQLPGMGLLPAIRRILERLPATRQTLLFSATLPEPIVELAREMLCDPVALTVEQRPVPAAGAAHAVYPVQASLKPDLLLELLRRALPGGVLVFTRTGHRADRLAGYLDRHGVECARICGKGGPSRRSADIAGSRRDRHRVLVATDAAASGRGMEALGSVVNFDVPQVPDDYIRRVGRASRARAAGHVLSLVAPEEEKDLRAIERHIGRRLSRLTLAGFDYRAGQPGRPPAPGRPAGEPGRAITTRRISR
jgi:ATP-dependent RNA helicase RhlE